MSVLITDTKSHTGFRLVHRWSSGLYLSDFHWGRVRVSTGCDWPSDYSGHGDCQIGKWRIVVHKYTGLARKWNGGG